MSKKRGELPTPPKGPFSRGRGPGRAGDSAGTADRMAMAMAEGKIEEFIKDNFGATPYAENLAMMMLGASGMLPAGSEAMGPAKAAKGSKDDHPGSKTKGPPPEVPADVLEAAQAGDVERLKGLLSEQMGVDVKKERKPGKKAKPSGEEAPREAVFEKPVMDTLVKIASENDVSVDWVIARALKLYARDYLATGRI